MQPDASPAACRFRGPGSGSGPGRAARSDGQGGKEKGRIPRGIRPFSFASAGGLPRGEGPKAAPQRSTSKVLPIWKKTALLRASSGSSLRAS